MRTAATFVTGLLCLTSFAAQASDALSTSAEKTDDARVEADLNRVVPEMEFTDTPLHDAVDRIASAAHANLYIDRSALGSAVTGIVTAKVNLRSAPNARLEAVLKDLVAQLGNAEHPGAFAGCGAMIVVSTKQGAKDFVERHRKALAKAKESGAAALAMNVPRLSTDRTFLDAIEQLRDATNLDIFVDWKRLKSAEVQRETRVVVRLRDVSLAQALQVLLDESRPTKPVYFEFRGSIIHISTVPDPKEGL